MKNFFRNTISVYKTTLTNSWWESIVNEVDVYKEIPCHFYAIWHNALWQQLETDDYSRADEIWLHKCMVGKEYTDIVWDMIWVLYDPDQWKVWKFSIQNVRIHRLVNWKKDHISFVLKKL